MKKTAANQTTIYQSKSGALELRTDLKQETIWANLSQISELFDTDKSGISRHINNIYKSGELARKATVAKFATVQKEGNREISRDIDYFNLDLILSVGYRVNSKQATHFRQWATKTLKEHIVKGYTINRHRIKNNYTEFLKAVDDVKSLLPAGSVVDNKSVLELVSLFADTWLSLSAYDQGKLITKGVTKKKVAFTAEKLGSALAEFKYALIAKYESARINRVNVINC